MFGLLFEPCGQAELQAHSLFSCKFNCLFFFFDRWKMRRPRRVGSKFIHHHFLPPKKNGARFVNWPASPPLLSNRMKDQKVRRRKTDAPVIQFQGGDCGHSGWIAGGTHCICVRVIVVIGRILEGATQSTAVVLLLLLLQVLLDKSVGPARAAAAQLQSGSRRRVGSVSIQQGRRRSAG